MAECPPVSQLMAFVGHLSWFGHSLAQCPTCLQIRHLSGALFFKGVGFALGLPLGEASGHALSLSFSPFPGLWPPSPVLCYKRYWWLSGPSHQKRQQGPASVAVVTLSWCQMHIGTGICPLKSLVPHKSLCPDC